MIVFKKVEADSDVPLPVKGGGTTKQLAALALQQANFQAKQQKLNSQLALQLATLTAKERKQNV